MGSYPTQRTPAFSQDWQRGRRWSQRFLRSRQRLQAETFRNEEEADEGVTVEWAGEMEDTAAGAELVAGLVAGSVCVGVSEGCGLFLPEETGDRGEEGLGIVRTE
jgi:hypothetical protein